MLGIFLLRQGKAPHCAGARVGAPWEDSGAGARATKWAGSRACSAVHFRPTPTPSPSPRVASSLSPFSSPVCPNSSPPLALSASLASCPSPPAPSGSLTAGSGLESSGGCFSLRNPVKFHRSRGGEPRSSFTGAGGALVFAATG